MKPINTFTVLFVDDETAVLNSLRRFLRKEEYRVLFANSGKEALEMLQTEDIEIIVSDLRMPAMDGLLLLEQVKNLRPDTIRIILSATRDIEQAIDAINTGEVFRFIAKPFEPEQFKKIIRDAILFYKMKTEHDALVQKIFKNNEELKKTNDEMRALTQALRVSEEKFRLISENAHDAVIMIKDDDTIVYWNAAASRMFKYSSDEAEGSILHDLITPLASRDDHLQALKNFRETGTGNFVGKIQETSGLQKDGGEISIELSISPVRVANRWFAVGIARDITERVASRKAKTAFETMQRELEAKIEKDLLQVNAPTRITGASISSLSLPSGHLDGDFIDFIQYDATHFDLLVGDVMGKGVQSALVGAGIKSFFLKAISTLGGGVCSGSPRRAIEEVVSSVHAQCIAHLLDIELFSTLCFARFDLETRELHFVDCGHMKTIHYRRSEDQCHFLEGNNLPLGMVEHASYSGETVSLATGDVLLFYSDGLTEAADCDDTLFGQDRLSGLVQDNHDKTPGDIVDLIMTEVLNFSCNHHLSDDSSCVAIRFDFSHPEGGCLIIETH